MTFRTMLLTAALVLPLAFDSTPVMAQERGQARAPVSTTQSQPVASTDAEEPRQDEAPQSLVSRLAAGLIDVLPDGIVRRFGNPEPPAPEPVPEPAPEPAPEPEPEPEPEPCVATFGYQNGVPGTFDCNGVFTPLGG